MKITEAGRRVCEKVATRGRGVGLGTLTNSLESLAKSSAFQRMRFSRPLPVSAGIHYPLPHSTSPISAVTPSSTLFSSSNSLLIYNTSETLGLILIDLTHSATNTVVSSLIVFNMAGWIEAQEIIHHTTVTLTTNIAGRAIIKKTADYAYGRQNAMDKPLPTFLTKIDEASEEQKSGVLVAYKQTQATLINERCHYDWKEQAGYIVLYPRYFETCPGVTDDDWQNAEIVQVP
jgi:hypothetical protein